jgi:hypothetical protein
MTWDDAAEPKSWTWTDPATRQARNVAILELWAMGFSRQEIAEQYDLTPVRIGQIINDFGQHEKEVVLKTHRNRQRPTS